MVIKNVGFGFRQSQSLHLLAVRYAIRYLTNRNPNLLTHISRITLELSLQKLNEMMHAANHTVLLLRNYSENDRSL